MEASDPVATWALVVSIAAFVASSVAAVWAIRLQRADQNLNLLSGMLNEIRSATYRENIDYIRDRLQVEYPHPEGGLRQMRKRRRAQVRSVMSLYNAMGALVVSKVAPLELLSALMGGSVVESWQAIYPYLDAERRHRGNDTVYYAYFEHLATELKRIGPTLLAERLVISRWESPA